MSTKKDLMKEIEASVRRKKALAQEISREKSISHLVAQFFTEIEKIKHLQQATLVWLSVRELTNNLNKLDKGVRVSYREGTDNTEPQVEIYWSATYVQSNECEPVTVLDASTASFQNILEQA